MMKIRILNILSAGLLAGIPAGSAAQCTAERIAAAVREFYTEYGILLCGSEGTSETEAELFEKYLTPSLAAKVRQVRQERLYDPIVRAQDFSSASVPTLSVVHDNGDRYNVYYTDTYDGRRVSIPVKAEIVDGSIRLTDIIIE